MHELPKELPSINILDDRDSKANKILHTKSKDVTFPLDKDTKFEDILKICESSLDNFKKNDIELIKNLLIEKSLLDANVYQELIGKDEKLNNLLLELIKKK